MLTFDSVRQGWPTFDRAYTTHDGRTVDSPGAFLIGELERLDPTLHMPLAAVTWQRDIDLREDVSIADESASFTNSSFGSAGGITPTGVAWAGKVTTAITGIGVDIFKTPQPLTPWEMEIKYSILELESAIKVGRPIDVQKYEGMQLKHQMDIDQVVYVGDSTLGFEGIFNKTSATMPAGTTPPAVTAVPVGAGGGTTWVSKSPDEILADVNLLIESNWASTGYAVIPDRLLVPPVQYNELVRRVVSLAGSVSVLKFLEENNLARQRGGELTILPVKWGIGMGVGGTPQVAGTVDRMVAYSKDRNRIRYPMTMLQRTPVQYIGMYHQTTYYCRLGNVEFVYPETVAYADGI